MRHTATWKDHERRTAQALGGKRLGATGVANPDVVSQDGHVIAECKHRKVLPSYLTAALRQVRSQASPDQLAMVVLHEHGARDSIVCVSLADWKTWYGDVPASEEPT